MKTALAWMLCLVVACGAVGAAEPRPPNVLFIIVDDLATTLGCYGDPDARTPHMDALAARGVRFDRAYTQFALCNPSRCSFLTGCYPERTGVFDLRTRLRTGFPDAVTLPQLFANAGYATGRVGKVFHAADPRTKLDVEVGAALDKDAEILEEAKLAERSGGDVSDPPHTTADGEHLYNRCHAPSGRPDRDFTDHRIADDSIETLERFRDRPFFLAVGFIRPHTPFVAPRRFFSALDPSMIAMPEFYQARGEDVSRVPAVALRPNNNVFRFQPPTPSEAREARRAYLAATAWVDFQIGRVLAKLTELGLDDRTVVLLTSDHGYHLGEHGLWAKQTLFEEGTRVPLIVVAPGVKPGVCAGLVEQVDIYPTLAGLAGITVPDHVQGTALRPMLENPASRGKSVVYSTMVSKRDGCLGRSCRTERFRYVEWDEGRSGRQFYDHEIDPHELTNLADDPRHADSIQGLRARLVGHLNEVVPKPSRE